MLTLLAPTYDWADPADYDQQKNIGDLPSADKSYHKHLQLAHKL